MRKYALSIRVIDSIHLDGYYLLVITTCAWEQPFKANTSLLRCGWYSIVRWSFFFVFRFFESANALIVKGSERWCSRVRGLLNSQLLALKAHPPWEKFYISSFSTFFPESRKGQSKICICNSPKMATYHQTMSLTRTTLYILFYLRSLCASTDVLSQEQKLQQQVHALEFHPYTRKIYFHRECQMKESWHTIACEISFCCSAKCSPPHTMSLRYFVLTLFKLTTVCNESASFQIPYQWKGFTRRLKTPPSPPNLRVTYAHVVSY